MQVVHQKTGFYAAILQIPTYLLVLYFAGLNFCEELEFVKKFYKCVLPMHVAVCL